MPRFFPSFGNRSRNNREQQQDGYGRWDEYDPRDPRVPSSSSARSRVIPNGKAREQYESSWDEEVLEQPNSYAVHSPYPTRIAESSSSSSAYDNHHRRPTVYDESENLSDATIAEEYDGRFAHSDTIPIVQRESSLTRLQEVFTDHGASTRPVTEVNLPQQNTGGSAYPTAPGVLPHTVPTPPVGQIHSTAELRNVYPEQHHPTLVPNMTTVSQHADIYHQSQSRRAREKRPQYRDEHEYPNPRYHNEYREEYHPRVRSSSSATSSSLGSTDEYDHPPCVVVIERGKHGKKDTYYVIPEGAPVIFKDSKGNELTRVGDFSERYKPRRQRPVIIEDSRGREIARLGYNDESSLDYAYRRRDSSEEGYRSRSRGYEYDRDLRYHDRDEDYVGSSRSHRSYETSNRYSNGYTSREEERYPSPRERSSPPNLNANIVYVPFGNPQGTSSTRAPSHHSGRSSRREYESTRSSQRSYDSQVIYLDQHRRQTSGSEGASSRSSGRRSHDSERRR